MFKHALALYPYFGDSNRAIKGLFPPTGLEYIAASMKDLVGKVEELKTVTADVVFFSDDNFSINPKRSEQLCGLIIENRIKKIFVAQTRIDIAKHPRILDKLEQATGRQKSNDFY